MKTTNAKAKAFQTPAGPGPDKETEKSQAPKTSARRPKRVTHADTVKLQIHGDESPLADREVEYAPPRPKDLPYESDVFPDGCLNYDALKPESLMKGTHQTYYRNMEDNRRVKLGKRDEDDYMTSAKAGDAKIMKMMEEEWTVGDVPETFRHLRKKVVPKPSVVPTRKTTSIPSKGPATITSRRAASALSTSAKPTIAPFKASKPAPKPAMPFLGRRPTPTMQLSNVSEMGHHAAAATSRSTIGYSKGRSAINVLQKREGGLTRSVSNMSQASDTTITPARFAEQENDDLRRLDFLKAFDVDDDELEPGLTGALPKCLGEEDEDEEFVLKLGS